MVNNNKHTSSSIIITNDASSTEETATKEQARQLRVAIDEQLELVRSLSFERQLVWSVEEQLANLVMIVSRYPEGALQQAVLMTHPASEDDDDADLSSSSNTTTTTFSGRLPIHLACDTNAPIEIIQWLLEHGRESILRKDKWGDLPIHTACSRKDVNVVRLLVESDTDKSTILTKDKTGALPIHMACRYDAPPQVIQLLLDSDNTHHHKSSLLVGGTYDQLPLHVACRCNLAPESIQLLLEHDVDKRTLLVQDNADRLPLHVAYLRNSHENVLQLLLQAMICGRMERIGLDLWKKDMHSFLKSLSTRERDCDTSYKLEVTIEALQDFMERVFVLELGVWKVSCIQGCGGGNDYDVKDEEYKKERRIKSGADVIVAGVMAFLEDEPVDTVLEKIKH